jgi:hypothetical protein
VSQQLAPQLVPQAVAAGASWLTGMMISGVEPAIQAVETSKIAAFTSIPP